MSVIVGESNGVDFSVTGTGESLQTGSVSDVPKSHGLVPRGGDDVAVIVRKSEVGDEVVVSGQTSEWNTVSESSFLLGEIPDDEGLISRSGDEDVVVSVSGGVTGNDGGDHITVSQKEAFEVDSAGSFRSSIN